MKVFTDSKNRKWELAINVGSLKRVRDMCNVDLVELIGKNLPGRLSRDPVMLGDILYALCKSQLDEAKVTDIDFGEALAGDAIESATAALLEEIISFFPSSRRSVLAATLEKARQVEAQLTENAAQRVASVDVAKLVSEAEKEMTPSNGSATNSEESAESIQDRSP